MTINKLQKVVWYVKILDNDIRKSAPKLLFGIGALFSKTHLIAFSN